LFEVWNASFGTPTERPMTGPAEAGAQDPGDEPPRERRPWIERIGLAAIAVVLGGLFIVMAVAAWSGGEPFLATMGAIGALMTFWVGALTVVRG
jgi:hypothetical protein